METCCCTNLVDGVCWALHDDLPVVDVVFVGVDGTSCRRLVVDVGQLLHRMLVACNSIFVFVNIAHLEDTLVLGHDGGSLAVSEQSVKASSVLEAEADEWWCIQNFWAERVI